MNDLYAMVRSIRERRWSRNRNFDAHATAEGAQARRLHRFLAGVEHDVLGASEVKVTQRGDRYLVAMSFDKVRSRRVVVLDAEEYALLVENPRIAALMADF